MISRGAAQDCSPGRKPRVESRKVASSEGAEETTVARGQLLADVHGVVANSFALLGLGHFSFLTRGLRPGLHYCAASRLRADEQIVLC
jgi:hypothetical protein